MILTHIHHKMAIYKDCTLFELLMVSLSVLIIGGLCLSILTKCVFGYASIGSALILFSFVHISRFFLSRLQKLKSGKPYGYYWHLCLRHLAQNVWTRFFYTSPCVMREGRWSVRRTHAAL